jgi:hypothetical protein
VRKVVKSTRRKDRRTHFENSGKRQKPECFVHPTQTLNPSAVRCSPASAGTVLLEAKVVAIAVLRLLCGVLVAAALERLVLPMNLSNDLLDEFER